MANKQGSREIAAAIINNIPEKYHSADLRNYFSQFIESGKFNCFHYRHRPEAPITKNDCQHSQGQDISSAKKTFCCVVKLEERHLKTLIKLYHRKHWLDTKGDSIRSYCCITKIRVSSNDLSNDSFKTREEQKNVPPDRHEFTQKDLLTLPELHPPDVMPNGNVGTPTLVFLDFIKQCRLPSSVIKKLGLSFPKTRSNRKYGSVPFNYGVYVEHSVIGEEAEECAITSSGHLIDTMACSDDDSDVEESVKNFKQLQKKSSDGKISCGENNEKNVEVNTATVRSKKKKDKAYTRKLMNENIEEKMIALQYTPQTGDDNDTCEEWERHEAVDDDPTTQERNKERLFEEEIELKWEKGGSGLVFYTDAQYWHQQEGDFDEQTADDLNVDMSGYYEDGAGDKDARDYLTLRQEQRRRDGTEDTDMFSAGIGKFEKHTKGIGRKILEQQGWKDGEGLGTTIIGIANALANEGQNPKDKKGFGYRGKKLARYVRKAAQKRADGGGIITTIYDNPSETDPGETLLRRNNPYGLKYRTKTTSKR